MAEELFAKAAGHQLRIVQQEEDELLSLAIDLAQMGKLEAYKTLPPELTYQFRMILRQRLEANGFVVSDSGKEITASWDMTDPAKRVTSKK